MSQTDTTLPEPLFSVDDTPRARTHDPLTSHAAADRSQSTRARIKAAVLVIVNRQGPISGNQINDLYLLEENPPAHFDSPRKRAGELAVDGYITADRSNGTEALYTLTEAGRALLAQDVAR